ncbi:BRO-N domain-containing protein [Stutzerimonas kunmingensis]|uniref:BRO-N domain-containing protein n=1 Tax=Stutzerimonas kunmingensis TaxID=1211807 RepID=UPI0028A87217|nr:BRO family protein [Stutzerimonas kunmingensis]
MVKSLVEQPSTSTLKSAETHAPTWASGALLRTAELDVLIGHPEHDLLFIATQVARAAGLKNPSKSAQRQAALEGCESYRVSEVLEYKVSSMRPEGLHAPLWHKMILMPESSTYQMLARGHAPQSQPFRDWVFKEVLPSIRKTGSYNVNASGLKS